MAITTPTLVGAGTFPVERIAPWALNSAIGEVGVAEELRAAPDGAGKALYLKHVSMSAHKSAQSGLIQDVKITLQDEDGTVLYGPIQLQTDGSSVFKKNWKNPLKLIDNKALYVFGNIGGASVTVYIEGFTGDVPLG